MEVAMSNVAASPDVYRRGAVLAASREQLVVMLYDGARRFLRQGAIAMREGQIERAHNALRRCELILGSLDSALDFEQGQVSERLHSIYGFCLVHLNRARLKQDATMVEEVSEMLGELRDAWVQIAAAAPHA
jgi:flagellar secretion chaperone FliS